MDSFVPFPVIQAAMAGLPTQWKESELLSLGKQRNTPLGYIRKGNRLSPALWSVERLCAFWQKRYHAEPEVVRIFCERLRAAAPVTADSSKRTKKKTAT